MQKKNKVISGIPTGIKRISIYGSELTNQTTRLRFDILDIWLQPADSLLDVGHLHLMRPKQPYMYTTTVVEIELFMINSGGGMSPASLANLTPMRRVY